MSRVHPLGVVTALSPSIPTLMTRRSPAARPAGLARVADVPEFPPEPKLLPDCQTAWASARLTDKHHIVVASSNGQTNPAREVNRRGLTLSILCCATKSIRRVVRRCCFSGRRRALGDKANRGRSRQGCDSPLEHRGRYVPNHHLAIPTKGYSRCGVSYTQIAYR